MSEFTSLRADQRAGASRYTLIRQLGQGGMGVVWLAQDERLGEPVALKFLPPEIRADLGALDDLRRETLKSRKLSHPHIVRIHDLHEVEGEPAFISMEYVEGSTLTAWRVQQDQRVLSWEQLQPLVKQLCEALDYAHGEKVIHRDLKPSNLMLDSKGRLKLADFGIAAVVSDSVSRVSVQRTSGTLAYMSPQQLEGRRAQVTDDIYALGATLYELLTSKPPFYTGDIGHQVLHVAPQPMEERLAELELTNEIPPDVAALVMACLAKDPAQRPQSAQAVAEWIGPEIGPKPAPGSVAQPAFGESSAAAAELGEEALAEELRPVGHRSAWLWAGSALLVVLLLGMGGRYWWTHRQPTQARRAGLGSQSAPSAPAGWIPLFDGMPLSAWTASRGSDWRVEPDGTVASSGPASYLVSPGSYTNFEFRAEIKISPGANGGMFFRAKVGTQRPQGYEAQVANAEAHISDQSAAQKTGSLYGFVPVTERLVEDDTWGTQHVAAVGNRIIIKVNGRTTVNYVDAAHTYPSGRLALQQFAPGRLIQYRNLTVKPLPANEAAAWEEVGKDMPDAPAAQAPAGRSGNGAPGFVWVRQAGGRGPDAGQGVAVDKFENVCLTGTFSGNATFGDARVSSAGSNDVFLAKFDDAGVLKWVQTGGGALEDYIGGLGVDSEGNCYITGGFQGLAKFGSHSLAASTDTDAFLVKYDAAGTAAWLRGIGGRGRQAGYSVAVDQTGICFLTGPFDETADFGSVRPASRGKLDAFTAKYDSTGAMAWARSGGGEEWDFGMAIGLDQAGNCYVSGVFWSEGVKFGALTLPRGAAPSAFLVKYSNDGAVQWLQKHEATEGNEGKAIAVAPDGSSYTLVSSALDWNTARVGKLLVARRDGSGRRQWQYQALGSFFLHQLGAAVDTDGHCYMIASFQSTAVFGETELTSAGDLDVVLAKLDPAGRLEWVKQAGGPGRDVGGGVCLSRDGEVCLTGSFSGASRFDSLQLTSSGDSDIFVAKLQPSVPSTTGAAGSASPTAKTITVSGELKCAACLLKLTPDCQSAIQAGTPAAPALYLLRQDPVVVESCAQIGLNMCETPRRVNGWLPSTPVQTNAAGRPVYAATRLEAVGRVPFVIQGETACLKCMLKQSTNCQLVINAEYGPWRVPYYLEPGPMVERATMNWCQPGHAAKVTLLSAAARKHADGHWLFTPSSLEFLR
ncbi:MAG: protein kinase [Verrucomicrobiota bacterium]